MVSLGTSEVCVYEYCGIYDSSAAVCYDHRFALFYLLCDSYDLFTGSVFYRFRCGGIYDFADGSASGGQCHDDQSWNPDA